MPSRCGRCRCPMRSPLRRCCARRFAAPRSPPPGASWPGPRPLPPCGRSAPSVRRPRTPRRVRAAVATAPTSSPAAPFSSTSTSSAANRRPMGRKVAPESTYRPSRRRGASRLRSGRRRRTGCRGGATIGRCGFRAGWRRGCCTSGRARCWSGLGSRLRTGSCCGPSRSIRRRGDAAGCRRRRPGAGRRGGAASWRSSGCASRSASTTTSASSTAASAATPWSGR